MKFKIVASLVILVAIFAALVLSGGFDSSSSNKPVRSDGIKLIP